MFDPRIPRRANAPGLIPITLHDHGPVSFPVEAAVASLDPESADLKLKLGRLDFNDFHLPPKWKDSMNSLITVNTSSNLGIFYYISQIYCWISNESFNGDHWNHPATSLLKGLDDLGFPCESLGCRAETRDATVGLRPTGESAMLSLVSV